MSQDPQWYAMRFGLEPTERLLRLINRMLADVEMADGQAAVAIQRRYEIESSLREMVAILLAKDKETAELEKLRKLDEVKLLHEVDMHMRLRMSYDQRKEIDAHRIEELEKDLNYAIQKLDYQAKEVAKLKDEAQSAFPYYEKWITKGQKNDRLETEVDSLRGYAVNPPMARIDAALAVLENPFVSVRRVERAVKALRGEK